MRWQEFTVITTVEAREAVIDLFYQVGAQGVVIEDPRDLARYLEEERWEYYDIPSEKLIGEDVTLKCYLSIDHNLPYRVEELQQSLADLIQHFDGHNYQLLISEVTENDWSEAWKKYYKPEKIGKRIVIVPSWEKYQMQAGEVTVLLDPGMAFGTGTHPTTAMCLRALEKYLQPGQNVIDVGTGSGILAVSAALLGAEEVVAVDEDPLAVRIAGENALLNNVQDRISVRQGDLLAGVDAEAHLLSANIVASVIERLAPQAAEHLTESGIFIASGIIRGRLAEVEHSILTAGFCIVEVQFQEEWVTVVGIKEDAA